MKKLCSSLAIFLVVCCSSLTALGNDSSRLRISLLTCTPGEELYSTFGHSALRVVDSNSVTDIVYNYGTFDFNDEGFYIKFTRGQLMYFISITSFEQFIYDYQYEMRGITEQVLDLTPTEAYALQQALNTNLQPENRFYKYDFFLDNCTTRLRDLIVKHKDPVPSLPPAMPVDFRFRQAIHHYLDMNKKYWSKLGIDLLLGARTDAVMTSAQQHFLPDNLMVSLDSNKPVIVRSKEQVYPYQPRQLAVSLFTPMVCFGALLLIFIGLYIIPGKAARRALYVMDGLLFFLVGALGIIMVLMWVATDHSMTKDNFNLLWAWPTHLVISLFTRSSKDWVRKYFGVSSVIMLLLLLTWFFLPQQMNNALLPLVVLLFFRSLALYSEKRRRANKDY